MWHYFWLWLVSHWERGWEKKLNRNRKSVNGTVCLSLQDGSWFAIISLKHVNYPGRCCASLISSSQSHTHTHTKIAAELYSVIINKVSSNYLFVAVFPVLWTQTVLLVAVWEVVRICIDEVSHGHGKSGNIRELWFPGLVKTCKRIKLLKSSIKKKKKKFH